MLHYVALSVYRAARNNTVTGERAARPVEKAACKAPQRRAERLLPLTTGPQKLVTTRCRVRRPARCGGYIVA